MFGEAHGAGDAFIVVALGVGALIVASYPVIRMIGWWIDGGAEPVLAMLSIVLYLVLVASAMAAPPGVAALIFLVILASAVLTPIIGQAHEQAQLKTMDNQAMDRFAQALERNPHDAPARIALAELLHKRGERDQAIKHLTWTLQAFPSLSMRIRPQLDSWRREKEREDTVPPVICHICHAENAWNAVSCENCGAAFGTRAGVRQQVASQGGPRMLIRGWIVTATALFVVCFLFLYTPAIIAGPIAIATLIAAVWLFLRWVGGDMGTIGD